VPVYEEGPPEADICFLGEAPASIEEKMDRPFVGPTGRFFNDLLHEAGITRGSCYILNAIPERIFKSKDDRLWFNRQGETLYVVGRGFTERGKEVVEPTIRRLLQSKANVICPMGGAALALSFGDHRIGKWRGSILESVPAMGNRKLVPTFHPAFILRGQYIHRYTVVSDFKRVLAESTHPERRLPERNLLIDPTWDETIAFLEMVWNDADEIATDIEILNRHVSCFSIAVSPWHAISIPLLDGQGHDRWSEEQEVEIWHRYAEIMNEPKIRKVNQNLLFDITILFQQNHIFTEGIHGDPMLAHGIIYPDFPKGLDFLCSAYTREPYYKDDGKLWSKPWRDPRRFWRYNALDSCVALEAWHALRGELADGYQWTYDETLALFEPLMYMMVGGVRVNLDKLRAAREKANALLREKEAALAAVAERPFNPTSPKQCQEYFYVTKGIKPYTSLKTGNITTDDQAMARIFKRFNLPEAKLVQEIRGLRKLIGTYLEVTYDSDQRIRCAYNPRGTTSGRLSSQETVYGTGMNMQNLDPAFKDFLEADPL